ncbi:MAG: O-antigen ligase family protein [bacterium]|nr:O-antigen ligase family protein [bacterium]
MEKLKTLLQWLDKHLLTILVIGFIFIIPLYPKLPFKMINYTYVAVRLEDFYMVIISLVYFIQFLRKKVTVPWGMLMLCGAYWISVFVSYLYGYFIQESIAINHLGFLHSLRRIEYMAIFFIVYTTIRSKKDFYTYINLIFMVLFIVGVYGFGQRFAGWPAVQTMNPEFAKGYFLVLESWARISSTFAGHYDLGGYLILLMPIIIGCYIATNKKVYFALFTVALMALILSASRASYLAYAVTMIPFLIYVRKFKVLIVIIALTAILTPLSDNLTSRISRTFQQTQIFVNPESGDVIVPRVKRADTLPPGDYGINSITTGGAIPLVEVDSKAVEETKALIKNSVLEEAERNNTTLTTEETNAMVNEIFGTYVPVNKNLLDISISTRFQVAWPRAIAAFIRNPLLGTGPSSLGEATDGDYLRWIGELGLLGTTTFLAILGTIFIKVWKATKLMTRKMQYLYYGFLFGIAGVFFNAGYIDLFEASKLAYTFWLVAGVFFAAIPFVIKKESVDKLKL